MQYFYLITSLSYGFQYEENCSPHIELDLEGENKELNGVYKYLGSASHMLCKNNLDEENQDSLKLPWINLIKLKKFRELCHRQES